jgi:hypothetical protein
MRAAILGAVLLAVTASSGIALAQETQSESATAEPACSATTPCLRYTEYQSARPVLTDVENCREVAVQTNVRTLTGGVRQSQRTDVDCSPGR